jgi:hypothetical protein
MVRAYRQFVGVGLQARRSPRERGAVTLMKDPRYILSFPRYVTNPAPDAAPCTGNAGGGKVNDVPDPNAVADPGF